MAEKLCGPIPIFSPISFPPSLSRPSTEIRFSRWNNANAEPFLRRRRAQNLIDDDLRRHRRFQVAQIISETPENPKITKLPSEFPSKGTPSAPSSPSIPGKKSKYSSKPPKITNPALGRNHADVASIPPGKSKYLPKPPKITNPALRPNHADVAITPPEITAVNNGQISKKPAKFTHPAFRRNYADVAITPLEITAVNNGIFSKKPAKITRADVAGQAATSGITVGDNGVSYRMENAPFEFQYSYTETPKVTPLGLREPLYLPFGPGTMGRPWTGRKPIGPSKKDQPEFDSFKPPPPGKKGVKPVQAPGPFWAGNGPDYRARTREEVLGEELSKEEVKDLIKGCVKTKRQLNIGRDGLTHNMLDNIHAHWKRRRVCKIKCKGVCTVDMDNVRQQLEEKTGGKVIFSRGGVIFLFRGRNYNYRTRPKYPLMLWKPIPPVYPRLVQRAPEGLTLEEATEMRKIGRSLTPICKLGKNGVYCNLVREVREAFEVCELIRINCQGLNKSDTRKIGAKLKDLVPCVLISFEHEHILMWRGRNWQSCIPTPPEDPAEFLGEEILSELAAGANSEDDEDENSVWVSDEDSDSIESTTASESESEEEDNTSPSANPSFDRLQAMLTKAVEDGGAVILEPESLNPDAVKEKAAQLAKTSPVSPTFQHRAKKQQSLKPKRPKTPKRAPRLEEEELLLDDPEDEAIRFLEVDRKSRSGRRREPSRTGHLDVVPRGSLGVDELAKLLS